MKDTLIEAYGKTRAEAIKRVCEKVKIELPGYATSFTGLKSGEWDYMGELYCCGIKKCEDGVWYAYVRDSF